tara:strand:+ start:22657 stop:22926 length:270 start_codon:yes stop_codon:yes gene_type:complete
MNKKDIIKNIVSSNNISYVEATKFLDSFIIILKKNLTKSDQKFSSFGTFYYYTSKARLGRNPKTKEQFPIQSMKIPKFKASNQIKKILN